MTVNCGRCGRPKADHTPNADDPAMCPGYVAKTTDPYDDQAVLDDMTTVSLIDATQAAVLMIDRLRKDRGAPVETKPNGAKLTNVITWDGQDPLGPNDMDEPSVFKLYVAKCATCGCPPQMKYHPSSGKVLLHCDRCGILIMDTRHLPKD